MLSRILVHVLFVSMLVAAWNFIYSVEYFFDAGTIIVAATAARRRMLAIVTRGRQQLFKAGDAIQHF